MENSINTCGFRHFKPLVDLILFARILSKEEAKLENLPLGENLLQEIKDVSGTAFKNPYIAKHIRDFVENLTTREQREEILRTFERQHHSRKMYFLFFGDKVQNQEKYDLECKHFINDGKLSLELNFLFQDHFSDLLYLNATEIDQYDYKQIKKLYSNEKQFNKTDFSKTVFAGL